MNANPRPLQWGATFAAMILATAIGGLIMGSCGYVAQTRGLSAAPAGPIAGFLGLWGMTAGFIYAANQQWIGRLPKARVARFGLCLLIGLPLQVAVVVAGVNVFEGLGGHM
jgi:hypothetical protein